MACFLVPAGVAVVTTVVQKVAEKKEREASAEERAARAVEGRTEERAGGSVLAPDKIRTAKPVGKWTRRLRWLNTMLWGGVALLCLEHIWHGEVVPWPPFLTAMQTPGEVGPMLREMATYGSTMTVVILVAWAILVGVVELRARARQAGEARPQASSEAADGGA